MSDSMQLADYMAVGHMAEFIGSATKVLEPSAIRRGRNAVDPVWYVTAPDNTRWRFQRKRDAVDFIAAGCVCPDHKRMFCKCGGQTRFA